MDAVTNLETALSVENPAAERKSAVPFWCAAIVVSISALVLLGWTFEIDFLKRIVPGYVFMNPAAAAAFILSSAALYLLQSAADARRTRIAQICAAVVFLVGSIKLCAIFGFFDFGIDQIFFPNQLFDALLGQPNRMAPNTAFNFLLLGAALLLFNVKTKRRESFPAQYPALLVLLSSFVAVIGYLYGAKHFYIVVSFIPMAIHTAVSFLLLSIGLLVSKPRQGLLKEMFSPLLGGQAARRMLPLVVFIPLVLGWLRLYGERNGFYQAEMGTSMLVVAIIIVLSLIVINNARLMNKGAARLVQTEEALTSSAEMLRRLGESEESYRQLADAMPQMVWVANGLGTVDYFNRRWVEYTGFSVEELNSAAAKNLIHADDVQQYLERWAKSLRTGENYKVEYRLQRGGDGAYRWHLGQALLVRDAENKIVKWFGTCTDIHEQKKVQDELRRIQEELETRVESRTAALERANSELTEQIAERAKVEKTLDETAKRERAMIENALDVICTIDADGRFSSINPASFKMWGYRPDELIGRKYIELVAPEDVLKTNETAQKIMSGEEVGAFENCCRHKNGTLVHTMWTCYWSKSEQSIFAVAHDVTERKQVENERQVINEIIQGISVNSNLDDLLKLVHQSIGRAIYAENCFVALYDKKSELLRLPFWTDKYDEACPPQKLGRGLTSYVFRRGRPAFLTEKDIRRLVEQGEIELIGTPPAVWLGVPLRTPTEVIGVLVVQHYEDETAYTKRDLELLASAGDQIAVAIERKRAEEAVQNSRDYLDRIINAVADPIFVKNRQHEWTLVNDAMCRILGREREELIGRTDYEFLPVAEAETTRAKDEAVFTTGKEDAYEADVVDSFGERRVTVTRKRLHVDKDGEQFVVGVVSDITANKRIEEVLKAGETMQRQLAERQSAILDALPAHICLLDPSGNLLEVNNEWKQFAAANDYRGMNYGVGSNYIATCENAAGDCAEGAKQAAEICRSVLSGDSSYFELEYPCHSPNEERWFKLSVTPLHREKAAGVVVMHINITERKRIEAELERARDAALELVRLKSEFLANMSHEIRTPMNGVIGMTGVLLDTRLDAEQKDYVETIQTSADALLRIIDDILDFSKIEAGQLHFETIDFDLNEAVEGAVELLAERASVKEIELASLVRSDVPRRLRSDAGRLRQILTNLVGNAIKFTERGEVVVSVSKESETDNHVFLRFEVADTGIGISAETQKKLFQAFVQADGSTTRKYGGTGLGLTISKQLIEMMGGDIGIESEPGRGSTFWFTAHFEKQIEQHTPVQNLSEASIEGLRVLIVDDNATNRRIFVHQTNSWGMEATEAESGARALEILRGAARKGERFDVAILDLMMPEMDGFELAKRIKADESISKTHLILLPSYGKRGHGQQARDLKIAAYLQKPVRQSQLYNCLATIIGEASVAETPHQQAPRLITQHSLGRRNSQKTIPMAATEKVRILVAEDNPVNQKVAVKQLQSLGYAANVVPNGREAIEAVKIHDYDIVFMDCQMPIADGFEATAEIRRVEGDAKHTIIVAMTAHALAGEREKCLAAGMDDYVSKPVKIETLRETLEKWLARTGANRAAANAENSVAANGAGDIESLDESVLAGFADLQSAGEPDIVTELIDLFLADAPKRIASLRQAGADGDVETIKKQAHAVKGASGNIGARRITAMCKRLEENSIDISRTRLIVSEMENEFETVARILKSMRKTV